MNDSLYIIGNGFDLHHGMKTSYNDFREYAKKQPYLWRTLSELYGEALDRDMWWYHFEEMLGKIDYLHLMKSKNGIPLGSTIASDFLGNNLPVFFGKWVKDFSCCVEPDNKLKIYTDALFFSFNYTLLLENVYGISTHNIWHIHNSLNDINIGKNIIVGHDSNDSQLFRYYLNYKESHPETDSFWADDYNKTAANGAKKVKNRIESNHDRFQELYSNIEQYYVLGFSFNAIDIPYIEKIIDVNRNPAQSDWTIYWHSEGEDEIIRGVMHKLGVKSENIDFIKW